MNILLPFLAFLLSPVTPDQPVPAGQPATSAPTQVVTTQQARGDLDWSLPELQYKVQPGPPLSKGPSLTVVVKLALPPDLQGLPWYTVNFKGGSRGHKLEIDKTEASQHFTDAQRKLLMSLVEQDWPWIRVGTIDDRVFVRLPAATEEDAPWMVQALVEAINARRIERRAEAYRDIAGFREQASKTETLLGPAQEEAKAAADAAGGARKRFGYAYSDDDQVQRDLVELQRSARLADIEVKGIQAKLEAIARASQQPPSNSAIEVLKRLQVEQDIELAGALARVEAIRSQQAAAKEVLDLSRVAKEKRTAAERLSSDRQQSTQRIAELERKLSEPDPEYAPVKFLSNEVGIRLPAKE